MPKVSDKKAYEMFVTNRLLGLMGGYFQPKMPQLGYGLINYNTPEGMAEELGRRAQPRQASQRIPAVPPNLNESRNYPPRGPMTSMPIPPRPHLTQSNIMHQEYGPNELENSGRPYEPYLNQSESVNHDIYPTPRDRHPEVFTGDFPVSQSQFLGPIQMTKGRTKQDKKPGGQGDMNDSVSRVDTHVKGQPYSFGEIYKMFDKYPVTPGSEKRIEEKTNQLGDLLKKFVEEKDLAKRYAKQEDAKLKAFESGRYLQGVPSAIPQHTKDPRSNLIRHERAVRSGRAPRQSYPRPNVQDRARFFLDEDERERAESQLYNSQVQPLDRSYQYDINGPLPNYVPYQPTHGPGNVVQALNAIAMRNSKGFKRISSLAEKKARVALEKKLGQKFKEDKAFRNPENYPSSKALKGYKRKKRVPDITDEALRFLDEDEREKLEGRGRKGAYRKK